MPNRLSRYCEGVMEASWLLALILTPLFFNVYSSRVFEPDKISLLRSLALIVLAAWLIKLGVERGLRFQHVPAEQVRSGRGLARIPLILPVAALVVVYLISTAASVSSYASIFGSYQRLQGTFTTFSYIVMFAAIVGNLRRRAQAERLLTTVIVTSLPISLYGILQHYRLDPLPWGGDTTLRVTANMGNAIFVAAYLIMSSLVVLGRVVTSFRAILTSAEGFWQNMTRATAYVFILAVNLVAIYFSGSRGPWLGLLAGLFFFFVLLALYWRVRALALASILTAAAAGVLLVVLNIPGGPLQPLLEVPGLGRLGGMLAELEGRSGTGQVRALIWGGVVEMMTPHPPLEYPDGAPDAWNSLRPLIGYGPESVYVAFNRFYPPELGQLEARNATPDRSHNETFDALAITGLLGLGVYLALFTTVFYYGLKWVGFITSARRRNVFLLLVLGGGAAGAAGLVAWQGPRFFGIGLPVGMLLGLIAFLTLYALIGLRGSSQMPAAEAQGQDRWRMIALISLLSAVIAHFVEIHFGIAIVSTRTHFWIYAGLMFVLGYVLPLTRPGAAPAVATAAASAAGGARRRARPARTAPAAREFTTTNETWAPVIIGAGLVVGVLITLGFDYISNPSHSTQTGRILSDAFLMRPAPEGPQPSMAIFGLVMLTWILGGAVAYLEEAGLTRQGGNLSGTFATLALSIMLGGFSWLVAAGRLGAIAAVSPTSVEQLLASTDSIAGVLALFYVTIFLLLAGWAAALPAEWPGSGARGAMGVNVVGYVFLPIAAIFLAWTQNLQMIQADIIYKTALQFDDQGQPQLAIPIYEHAISMVPGQDYYYLFLGRSYLNATSTITDTLQREAILQQAEKQLKIARDLNPLNTDHSANLGRLNRQWATLAADPVERDDRLRQADQYYQQALSLSPHNAGLWNEWAVLKYQQMGDGDGAQQKLDESFSLDTKYDQTYQIQGELYLWRATAAADETARQDFYARAIQAFEAGLAVIAERGGDPTNMRIGLAGAYASTNQIEPAIEQYQALATTIGQPFVWQVFRAIAELYWRQGNLDQTRLYVQQAIDNAPDAEKPGLQSFLDALPPTP